ncbi:hypothetical protein HMPREF1250_1435 [Megasphaera vaginalis (ex Srinivasan et al. 2021)]|uniref:Uncharacterized protein n=1 Tax=Megasphaera vaginalis (ex Srinivasan et al. 2021) TaxID=1111454 RepID=U7UL33_9FIRM|nr:hypothetical protein HMPREF1250_1435 [Megasphaera vaginalis (ex Srinivasan et al. 2021)]
MHSSLLFSVWSKEKAAFSSAAFVFVGYVPPVPAYGDDWAMISLPST